jgi:hypothetical protein
MLTAALLSGCAAAASKAEDELRARLAASEAQRVLLVASLAKLNADASARAAGVATSSKAAASIATRRADTATQQRNDANGVANANAADAQTAVVAAQEADARAVRAAGIARAQADELIRVTERNNLVIYAGSGAGLLSFLTLLVKYRSAGRDHKWAVEKFEQGNKTVLLAVADGSAKSADALDHANHLTQKIVDMREDLVNAVSAVAAIPDATQTLVEMLRGKGAVSGADLAGVLGAMKASADKLEIYAHENVHRLANMIQVLQAERYPLTGPKADVPAKETT